MKLKFDGSQAYQLDAIHSIVDLFDGQPHVCIAILPVDKLFFHRWAKQPA